MKKIKKAMKKVKKAVSNEEIKVNSFKDFDKVYKNYLKKQGKLESVNTNSILFENETDLIGAKFYVSDSMLFLKE